MPPALPPHRYRLVGQTAGADRIAEAVAAIRAAKQPVLLVGHGVHTARAGESGSECAELMAAPAVQTSGGTSYIKGLEDRTFPYGFSPSSIDAVVKSDLCLAIGTELGEPVHFGRWRHWLANEANRTWVLIEQDPAAIGVNRPIDVPLVGDLRAIVPQLVEALKDTPRTPTPGVVDQRDVLASARHVSGAVAADRSSTNYDNTFTHGGCGFRRRFSTLLGEMKMRKARSKPRLPESVRSRAVT